MLLYIAPKAARLHDVIAWPARMKPPAGLSWSVTDPDRH